MPPGDDAAALAKLFREHFGHRDHLYGVLLAEMADDLDAGGVTALVCRDHLAASRADVVQLRLLAGIFRVVLRGEAPSLERFYPVLGGDADPGAAWPEVRELMVQHADELRSALDLPPQTNEAGRSACLLAGLFDAVRRHGLSRVRLLEPGASAGLNLDVDHYRFVGPGWSWGAADSPLVVDTGAVLDPVDLEVVERRGCDLAPVDAASPDGALALTSFVWPFDLDRHARLAAALDVVRRHPVILDRAPASVWLAEQLSRPTDDDVLTVVWHSITRQYWPEQETVAVTALVDQARERMPISHVAMEGVPPSLAVGGYDVATHGPETTVDGVVVARSHHHGPPLVPAGDLARD